MVKKLLAENILGGMTGIPSTIRTTVTKEVTTTENGEKKVTINGSFSVDNGEEDVSVNDVVTSTNDTTDSVVSSLSDEEDRITQLAGVNTQPSTPKTAPELNDVEISSYISAPSEDEIEDDLETLEDDMGLSESSEESVKRELEPGEELLVEIPDSDFTIEKSSPEEVGVVKYVGDIKNIDINMLSRKFGKPVHNYNDENDWDVAWYVKINGSPTIIRNSKKHDKDSDFLDTETWFVYSNENTMANAITMMFGEIFDESVEDLQSINDELKDFIVSAGGVLDRLIIIDKRPSYNQVSKYAQKHDVSIDNVKSWRIDRFDPQSKWLMFYIDNGQKYKDEPILPKDKTLDESVEEITQTVKNTAKEAYTTLHNVYKTVLRTEIDCDISQLTNAMKNFNAFIKSLPAALDETNEPQFKMWCDKAIKKGNNQPEDKKFKTTISNK